MKSRWIGTILCLLYLGISTVVAAVHQHDPGLAGDEQCAACAWHHDCQVDLPQSSAAPQSPVILFFSERYAAPSPARISLFVHPTRGPPSLPL